MTMVTLADGTQVPASSLSANDPRVIVVQQPPPPPVQNQPEVFTMDQVLERVEAARKEEKDKLYETQEQLNNRLKVFEDERTRVESEAAAAQAAADEAERLRQQSELTAIERLEATQTEWQQRFDQQQQEIAAQAAVFQKEREFAQIAAYRNQRVAELGDAIDPRFLDFVGGNNPEEIEASLYIAAQKTAEIGQEVQAALAERGILQQDPAQQQQQQVRPAVPVTSGPGYTPEQYMQGVQGQERQLTAAEIAAMPMSDYMANREQLLSAASRQVSERGLYG